MAVSIEYDDGCLCYSYFGGHVGNRSVPEYEVPRTLSHCELGKFGCLPIFDGSLYLQTTYLLKIASINN